jgi:phosphoserine phosphatase RsbX
MAERPLLEWDVAERPLEDGGRSGDEAVVVLHPGGALAAAVDGLGHGPEAAEAARATVEVLRRRPEADVVALARACHEAARPTRGAALSLAAFDPARGAMTWLGVGNVEGRLVRGGDPGGLDALSLAVLPGLAGHELPTLLPVTVPVRRGDTLILATDGIDPHFADGLTATGSCADIAARILERHGRPTDDALVLVVRYLGDSA